MATVDAERLAVLETQVAGIYAILDRLEKSTLRGLDRVDGKLDEIAHEVQEIKQHQAGCMVKQDQRWVAHDKVHSDQGKRSNVVDIVVLVISAAVSAALYALAKLTGGLIGGP